jgi:hypothetical protein
MVRNKDLCDHVLPHRVWAYLHFEVELGAIEHDHILECERCIQLFMLCLRSDNFGAVLKKFENPDERQTA